MTDYWIYVIERHVAPEPMPELFSPPNTTLRAGDAVVIQDPYGDFIRLSQLLEEASAAPIS